MNSLKIWIVAGFIFICNITVFATDQSGNKSVSGTGFLAGTSKVKITPPIGGPLLDNARRSTGVNDELFARALVLGDGKHKVAIVSFDLEEFDMSWSDRIREKVREKTGIAVTMLNSIHTHSAPILTTWNPVRDEWFNQGEGLQWRDGLTIKVVDAVAQAVANMTDANLRVGRAPVKVGSNRRLPTEKGIVMKPNPDGPVVPWVDVLRVDNIDGNPIAVLFSHAAHPVIIHAASTLISADYPGYAVKEIKQQLGGGVMAMFVQACGADINGDPLQGGFNAAKRAGEMLGAAVVKAANESETIKKAELYTTSATMALPFQDLPDPEECKRALAEAEKRQQKAREKNRSEDEAYVFELRDLLAKSERREHQTLRFEMQLLAIGKDWCLLAMPHEIFAEYQLWTDKNSPFRHTMVLGYTNGIESYIPIDKDILSGGYETVRPPARGAELFYPYRAALKPGIEKQIKTKIGRLLKQSYSRTQ
jgi:hypothetical protein